MKWNVKTDFCANGGSYGKCHTSLYFPKARLETERELTAGEKARINDVMVKAIANEMTKIDTEVNNG